MLKILHLHFFSGSGGKFIANCLSMSGAVAFQDYQIFSNYFQKKNIDIIEQALLNTIPEKTKSRTWWEKEAGCEKLFGEKIFNIIGSGSTNTIDLNDVGIFQDCWLPIISHDPESAIRINRYFSNDHVFFLGMLGNTEFTNRAIQLKWPNSEHCLDFDLFKEFKTDFEKLKFDHVIYDWDPLNTEKLVEIENLAELIDVNYHNAMAKNYIDAYVNFHL